MSCLCCERLPRASAATLKVGAVMDAKITQFDPEDVAEAVNSDGLARVSVSRLDSGPFEMKAAHFHLPIGILGTGAFDQPVRANVDIDRDYYLATFVLATKEGYLQNGRKLDNGWISLSPPGANLDLITTTLQWASISIPRKILDQRLMSLTGLTALRARPSTGWSSGAFGATFTAGRRVRLETLGPTDARGASH